MSEETELTTATQPSEGEKYINDINISCLMQVFETALSLSHHEERVKLYKESRQHLFGLSSTVDEEIYHHKKRWIELVANWLEIRITLFFPTMKNLKITFGENTDFPEISLFVLPESGHPRLGILLH